MKKLLFLQKTTNTMKKEVMTTIINGFAVDNLSKGKTMEERDIELCEAIARVEHFETRINTQIYACAQFEGFLHALQKKGLMSEESVKSNIAIFRRKLEEDDETRLPLYVKSVRHRADYNGAIILGTTKLEELYNVNIID